MPAVRVLGHSLGGVAALAAEVRQPGTFEAMYLFEPVIYDP
jgi:predicted alpha/beta superfamily hydrolase